MADQRRPNAGFAIKVACTVQGAEAQLYLNFCHHLGIGMPVDNRGREVLEDQLHRGVGFLRIPIDVGTWRKISAGETSKLAYICDVIFCETLIKKLMNDEYCKANVEFRPHLFELAMKTLESSLPSLKIERNVKLVKKCRYVNSMREEGGYDRPEPFQELQGAGYDEPLTKPAAPEPIIEEVKSGKKTKPVVKKGFFNTEQAKKAKPLYPEGSGEGVLPENAGDPLGYLPKKLRQTCKVVDCNNPEYAAAMTPGTPEYQAAAAAAAGKPKPPAPGQKEMEKMFGKLPEFERPSVFQEDKLVKDDDDGLGRYSNDYSRFDALDDEDEQPPAPPPTKGDPSRDYYYDERGNVVKFSDAPKASSTPAPPAQPTKPTQAQSEARAAGDEASAKLLEQLAQMSGGEGEANLDMAKLMSDLGNLTDTEKQFIAEMEPQMEEAMKAKGATPGPRPDAPDVKKGFLLDQMAKEKARKEQPTGTGSSDSTNSGVREVPTYTVAHNEDVRIVVSMPLAASMKGVDLDVAARTLRVESAEYLLECDLPCRVDPAQAKASFKKATRELVITVPVGK
jgi:hypothetical protein